MRPRDFLTDGRMPAFPRESCELTIAEIAALTRREVAVRPPPDRRIRNVAPLDTAGAADICFLDDAKHRRRIGDDASRRLPHGAAFRRLGAVAGSSCC